METKITIITNIQTKPRPKFARMGKFVRAYTPKTALSYERYIASEYQRQSGAYFGEKPIEIEITFYFKAPKLPKYKQNYLYQIPCTTHKDLDNLGKAVLDALNSVAYKDDKQVIRLFLYKWYTNEQERVEININELFFPSDETLKEIYKNEKNKIK